jgi:N-acetylmuramoyl-L-alanine amidase
LVLDPGHGGRDPGAVGRGGLQEKQVNLAVALAVAGRLKRQGREVVLTREADVYVSLTERVAAAQAAQADLLLSLHVNSSTASTPAYVSGHVLRLGGTAEKVARVLVDNLAAATGWPNGGVFTNNFYLLRESKIAAVLLEMGFISNPEQERWLARPENQLLLAEGIEQSLEKIYGEGRVPFQDIAGHWAQDAIVEANRLGLLFGYPDGTFRPKEAVTRGELAAVLVRLWQKIEAKGATSTHDRR